MRSIVIDSNVRYSKKSFEMYSICQAIRSRKSTRAFLQKNVDDTIIRSILEVARWAPSGFNHQPAKVAILGSMTKSKLSEMLIAQAKSGALPRPDYNYGSRDWPEIYNQRRKKCGQAMYGSMSILNDQIEAKINFRLNNYSFFHAPVGLIIYVDKGMPLGSWIDVGMFIQNILLSSQEFGLSTCAQASLAEYPDIVREVLGLEKVDIICGIAIGYEDTSHPVNLYRTEREDIEGFCQWHP